MRLKRWKMHISPTSPFSTCALLQASSSSLVWSFLPTTSLSNTDRRKSRQLRNNPIKLSVPSSQKPSATNSTKKTRRKKEPRRSNQVLQAFRLAKSSSFSAAPNRAIQQFLNDPGDDNHLRPPASNDISNSPPMAELYPNCTVFFADVAGYDLSTARFYGLAHGRSISLFCCCCAGSLLGAPLGLPPKSLLFSR